MVRLAEDMNYNDKTIDRILVCITAQGNSKRLICHGAEVADTSNAELHILHVKMGDSIFNTEDAPKLLEELFDFGSAKGGMIHCYCDDNIAKCIGDFAQKKGITKLVFGQPPTGDIIEKDKVLEHLKPVLQFIPKGVEIIIVPRQEEEEICIKI